MTVQRFGACVAAVFVAVAVSVTAAPAAVAATDGADAIRAKYQQMGGGDTPLEGPTKQVDGTLAGFFRKWDTTVAITWHPDHGAHWISGAIQTRWRTDLTSAPHGAAVADQVATSGKPGAAAAFTNGTSIYYGDATGAHVLSGPVRAKYWAMGATSGSAGLPVTDVAPVSGASGTFADFQGAITIHAKTGGPGLWFSGALRDRFRELGGYGVLGVPTTDQAPTPGSGWFFDLASGSMYWSAETGAHILTGPVYSKYLEFNSVKGPFGLPTTDLLDTSGFTGKFAEFRNAVSIFWSKETGAHWISGALRQEFWDHGSLAALGFPTSDQLPTSGAVGLYVLFGPNRAIIWGAQPGAHLVADQILAKLRADGDVAALGLPEYDEMDLDGTRRFQQFQRGSIFTVPGATPLTVREPVRAEWWKQGGWKGRLGLPTADATASGDLLTQLFAGGRIECRSGRCATYFSG